MKNFSEILKSFYEVHPSRIEKIKYKHKYKHRFRLKSLIKFYLKNQNKMKKQKKEMIKVDK